MGLTNIKRRSIGYCLLVIAAFLSFSSPGFSAAPCDGSSFARLELSQHFAFTAKNKKIALHIMEDGSEKVSRTVSLGRRFIAPNKIADKQISSIAEKNFQTTAKYVLDHIDELEINKNTAIKLNKMLTKNLVDKEIQGDYLFRTNATYAHESDSFVAGDPERFYKWLDSRAAKKIQEKDPIAFAEIIHNNIASLDSFPDGNGRLSRLLADLALMKAGYAPAYYTDMIDYFTRGTPRGVQNSGVPAASREARKKYFREIVEKGQDSMENGGR